jgi:hypothetical protein
MHGCVLGSEWQPQDGRALHRSAHFARPRVHYDAGFDATAADQHEDRRDQGHDRDNGDSPTEPALQDSSSSFIVVAFRVLPASARPGR